MKLPRKLVAIAAAVSFLLAGPVADANATIAYGIGTIYVDPVYAHTGSIRDLTWINPNNCANGAGGYNWYASDAAGQQYYPIVWGRAMSSIYNRGSWCNRVWLKSGPWNGPENYIYTTCLGYGRGIPTFGYPYDNNIKQVGFGHDNGCPA